VLARRKLHRLENLAGARRGAGEVFEQGLVDGAEARSHGDGRRRQLIGSRVTAEDAAGAGVEQLHGLSSRSDQREHGHAAGRLLDDRGHLGAVGKVAHDDVHPTGRKDLSFGRGCLGHHAQGRGVTENGCQPAADQGRVGHDGRSKGECQHWC
jgi:hypothetical protein